MAGDTAAQRAAQFLFDENKARARSRPIPDDFRPRTEAEAYAAQAVFQELLAGDGVGEIAGYKIGLTSKVMQRMANFGVKMLGLAGQLLPEEPKAPYEGEMPESYMTAVPATIYAGSNEIQRNIIATRGLGLPRGYNASRQDRHRRRR